MAVKNVLFVHGYSETSLGAYYLFPQLLSQAGLNVQPIVLSAFDSLDDQISISDLAAALDDHISSLERLPLGWDTANSAIICHSTGALIARRWMLDRLQANNDLVPSHLITMAGANHGSTLAQAGKSVLGYLQKLLLKHILSVGARVLTDLDYGSDFLLRLNEEWLKAINDPANPLSSRFCFSMGGDSIGNDRTVDLYWGSCEPGSDNTVRISGANLNYRMLVANRPGQSGLSILAPPVPVPHVILRGYSHFGDDTGVLGKARDASDPAFTRVLQALSVSTAEQYHAVATDWATALREWIDEAGADPNGRAKDIDSTVVFSLYDRGLAPVDDCMIAFLDQAQVNAAAPLSDSAAASAAMRSVSASINPHSPIHNDVQRASYSFYINWPKWRETNHLIHIEAHSSSPRIHYQEIDYQVPPEIGSLVRANEFTYVRVHMDRNSDDAYALYRWADSLKLADLTWSVDTDFPATGRLPYLPPDGG